MHLNFSKIKIMFISNVLPFNLVNVDTSIIYQIPGGNYSENAFPLLHILSMFSATKVS